MPISPPASGAFASAASANAPARQQTSRPAVGSRSAASTKYRQLASQFTLVESQRRAGRVVWAEVEELRRLLSAAGNDEKIGERLLASQRVAAGLCGIEECAVDAAGRPVYADAQITELKQLTSEASRALHPGPPGSLRSAAPSFAALLTPPRPASPAASDRTANLAKSLPGPLTASAEPSAVELVQEVGEPEPHAWLQKLFARPAVARTYRQRLMVASHALPEGQPLAILLPLALRNGDGGTADRMTLSVTPPTGASFRRQAQSWWKPTLHRAGPVEDRALRNEIIAFAEAAYLTSDADARRDPPSDGLALASHLMRYAARVPGRRASAAITPMRRTRFELMQQVGRQHHASPALKFALGIFSFTFVPSTDESTIVSVVSNALDTADLWKIEDANQKLWLCRCMSWSAQAPRSRAILNALVPKVTEHFAYQDPTDSFTGKLWFPDDEAMLNGLDWLLASEASAQPTSLPPLTLWPDGTWFETSLIITHLPSMPLASRALALRHLAALRSPGGVYADLPVQSEPLTARRTLMLLYQALSLALGKHEPKKTLPKFSAQEWEITFVDPACRKLGERWIALAANEQNAASLRVLNVECLVQNYGDEDVLQLLIALLTSPIALSPTLTFEVLRALSQVNDVSAAPSELGETQRPRVFKLLSVARVPQPLNTLHVLVAGYFHVSERPPTTGSSTSFDARCEQFAALLKRSDELPPEDRYQLHEIVLQLIGAGAEPWELARFTPRLVVANSVELHRLRRAMQSDSVLPVTLMRIDSMGLLYMQILNRPAFFKQKGYDVLRARAAVAPVQTIAEARSVVRSMLDVFSGWLQAFTSLDSQALAPANFQGERGLKAVISALRRWLANEPEWADGSRRCNCLQLTITDGWKRFVNACGDPLPPPWAMGESEQSVLTYIGNLLIVWDEVDHTPEARARIANRVRSTMSAHSLFAGEGLLA